MSIQTRRIGAAGGDEQLKLWEHVQALERRIAALEAASAGEPPAVEDQEPAAEKTAPKKRKRGAEHAEV